MIRNYLIEFSPSAVRKLMAEVDKKAKEIVKFPLLYPISIYDDSLRSVVMPYKYLLFYHVDEVNQVIEMYRLLHSAKNLSSML